MAETDRTDATVHPACLEKWPVQCACDDVDCGFNVEGDCHQPFEPIRCIMNSPNFELADYGLFDYPEAER